VRSEPAKIDLQINGHTLRKSQGDIKFLKTGEYNVNISAQNYQPWSKRLTVWADQVTWANPAPKNIFLFLKDPSLQLAGSGVLDFYSDGKNLSFLTEKNLVISPLGNLGKSQNYTLPKPADTILPSADGSLLILENSAQSSLPEILIFNSGDKSFSDISTLFSSQPKLVFSDNNTLYAQQGQDLYRVDWSVGKKTLLLSGIRDFTVSANTIYALQQKPSGLSLQAVSLPNLDQQALVNQLPQFSQSAIFVNYQKQILLNLDGTLYNVNSGLQKIAEDISVQKFDAQANTLIFIHAGEISSYNFASQTSDFISRSSETLKNPLLNQYVNYAFFFNGQSLSAAELDTRDRQNQYMFYKATQPQKFYVDSQAKNILVLDVGSLKIIKIR